MFFLTELEYYYNILCTYIFVELLPDLFILTLMFGFNKKKSVPAYYRSLCLLVHIVNCVMHIADQNSLISVLKKIQTFHFSHKRTSLVYLYTNHVRIIMLQPVHYLLIFFSVHAYSFQNPELYKKNMMSVRDGGTLTYL